ncbi:MAG TPA: hypothetical protein PKL83_01020 [bacterium]|nr:hypothetical protein [bacterium]
MGSNQRLQGRIDAVDLVFQFTDADFAWLGILGFNLTVAFVDIGTEVCILRLLLVLQFGSLVAQLPAADEESQEKQEITDAGPEKTKNYHGLVVLEGKQIAQT